MARLLLLWHVNLKYWHALGRWHAKLKNWHAFDTLTHWHVYWHVGTLARWHVDHAGTCVRMARNLANSNLRYLVSLYDISKTIEI